MTRLIRFGNNAVATLAGNITNADTTLLLTPGHGSRFPSLTAGQFFRGTLIKADGTKEIVTVTNISTDTLTIVRAVEPIAGVTTAFAFLAGDRFELRLTAGTAVFETDRLDYFDASGNVVLGPDGSKTLNIGSGQIVKDAAGNLGLGVTPSAWGGVLSKALEFNNGCYVTAYNTTGAKSIYMGANNYFNGASYVYHSTSFASQYQQIDGTHIFLSAPSGTAGNAISFTQLATLFQNGNYSLGSSTITPIGTDYRTMKLNGLNGAGFLLYENEVPVGALYADSGGLVLGSPQAQPVRTFVDTIERNRTATNGYFKASNTGTYLNPADTTHEFVTSANNVNTYFYSTGLGAGVTNVASRLEATATGLHFLANLAGVGTVFRVFANGSVEGQTEAPGSVNNYLASTAFVKTAIDIRTIGYSQSWQDVTGSRALATTYTNSTGRPIMVNVTMFTINSPTISSLIVDGVVVAEHSANIGGGANSNLITTMSAIVPVGSTYSATGVSLRNWAELR